MDTKLLFLILTTLAVVMATAKDDSYEMHWRLQDFLQMRPRGEKANCIKKCQFDCRGFDSNCCYWPGMKRHAKCRTIGIMNGIPQYMCVHPDFREAFANGETILINNDCNINV